MRYARGANGIHFSLASAHFTHFSAQLYRRLNAMDATPYGWHRSGLAPFIGLRILRDRFGVNSQVRKELKSQSYENQNSVYLVTSRQCGINHGRRLHNGEQRTLAKRTHYHNKPHGSVRTVEDHARHRAKYCWASELIRL